MAESQGIHITSTLGTSEERRSHRRSRVRLKIEEARRREQGIRPKTPPKDDSDPEKDRESSQQIAKSKERLKKLISDGDQLVSGVVVAGDSREVARRYEEDEMGKARYEKIDAEANASAERFEEIMKKWSQSDNKIVPQQLQEILKQQEQACQEMVDEKNKLVYEFEEELKSKDDLYVKHLKQQAEDVDLLVERMEEQAQSLVRAFQEELTQIEKAFELERRKLKEVHQTTLDEMYDERQSKESEYLETREKRMEENEAKIQHLRVQNAEEFNQVKIKLETDIQHLQQQIQQMKATFQLNAEKLEYNFQVLKKRDEENVVTISQQKRKLTRLQDVLNNLRGKLAKQEKVNKEETENLMNEYQKNIEQYKELQKKVRHFQLVDVKRFYDIWKMNEERVRELADSVANADRVIHQQQLGLEWSPPETVVSDLQPLLTQTDREVNRATMYASQVLSDIDEQEEGKTDLGTPSRERPVISQAVIKQTLELIANEGSFLIESKLSHLLAPLEKEEQMLMKLDSIFKALGIKSETQVEELVKYLIEEGGKVENETGEDSASTLEDSELQTTVHPNRVLKCLKLYSENRQSKAGTLPMQSVFGLQSNNMTNKLLESSFWKSMANSLPKTHEKLWTALQDGLEKYHSVLSSRSKLIDEANSLRQQNAELRLLLQQYMHSQVNRELEIPPTLVLPDAMDSAVY